MKFKYAFFKDFTLLLLMALAVFTISCNKKTMYKSFDEYPVYEGTDLGLTFNNNQWVFKVWSPVADEVVLRLYKDGAGGSAEEQITMDYDKNGVWKTVINKNINRKFYTYQIRIGQKWLNEVPDLYAKSVGVNGKRSMAVNLAETNPPGWENDIKPELKSFSDIILYELHIRDFSIHPESGIEYKGKYLAFLENISQNKNGMITGVDHLKELGITHVHLLPSFDYNSVDESRLNEPQYNWGYDPLNYNVPEGSYSTNPNSGTIRIIEFKQMVQALHRNGIRVVMDVVYNHTALTAESYFNQIVPGYFYRFNADSSYSNASGCGNETASERPMVRKYFIESVKYWATEYHVDGFRFDLMGIHDIETMKQIREELNKIDPTIFVYGEGWTAGASPLPDSLRAIKANTAKLNGIAAFCDEFRDAIKGHWSDVKTKGFVSGASNTEESVKFGIVGCTKHPQINYEKVNYSKSPWALQPAQAINYVSCHDNNTLWDKLLICNPKTSETDLIKMDKLANAMVLTSQGVPFIHAGEEFLRTKFLEHNSFNKPDSINQINWNLKTKNSDVFLYYAGLINLRSYHPAFRMPTTELITKHLEFLPVKDTLLIGYILKDNANGDSWKNIIVFYNGNKKAVKANIPQGNWTIVANNEKINQNGIEPVKGTTVEIPAISILILKEE